MEKVDLKIDRTRSTEAKLTLAGWQATRTSYEATNGAGAHTVVVSVARVSAKKCLQIAESGTPKAIAKYDADLRKIFASIRPVRQ